MAVTAEPGTTARAFLAWRTTASAMLVFWLPLPFLAPHVLKSTEDFQDLAFVILILVAYGVGVLGVVPMFAFTIGRWLDRRTASRGLKHSVLIFGLYGLGFGIVLALVIGFGGVNVLGTVLLVAVPLLSAVAGRVLVELRGRAWSVVLWATFVLAVIAALTAVAPMLLSGAGA